MIQSIMTNDTGSRILAKHMGHSQATQQRFHEFATADSALKAHDKLTKLLKTKMATQQC